LCGADTFVRVFHHGATFTASDGYVVSTPVFDPDEPEQPGPAEHHHEKKPAGGADSGNPNHQRH